MPVQTQFLRHVFDAHCPALATDVAVEPLCVEGMVRQSLDLFGLHLAAPAAHHPAHLHLQIDPHPFEVRLGTTPRKAVRVPQSGLSFHAPAHNGFANPVKAHCGPALIAQKAPPRLKTTHTNPRRAALRISMTDLRIGPMYHLRCRWVEALPEVGWWGVGSFGNTVSKSHSLYPPSQKVSKISVPADTKHSTRGSPGPERQPRVVAEGIDPVISRQCKRK